jgi:hypothetical protein
VREKPKGSAREMRELSAERVKCNHAREQRGVQEVSAKRENFGKVILIRKESVIE